MKTATAITIAMLLASAAAAVDPYTLTTEDKALYLKCAFILNGNTMVAMRSIDLTKWSRDELVLCIEPKPLLAEPSTVPPKRAK